MPSRNRIAQCVPNSGQGLPINLGRDFIQSRSGLLALNQAVPWKTNDWWTSQYNFDAEVRSGLSFPKNLEIHDVTLRDGEQTPGVVFTKQDKIEIAMMLDEARVQRIEAGMPLSSEEDRLAIKEIAKNVAHARIFAFCRTRKEDVDAALKCNVSGIVMEIPTLDERLKVMGLTLEQAAVAASEVISYAKAHGLFVVFFHVDGTRSDFTSIARMVRAGELAHADRIAVVDTVGGASPEGFSCLVRRVAGITRIPLEVHCHNTFGLGIANTIAGLIAGAKTAHVAANGIGEGAGNASLEELVVALKLLYGVDSGVDISKLAAISKVVERLSGIQVPANKPVIGRNLFTRESGMVVERYYKMPELARELETFDPNLFGEETEIVLGKKSGKYSIMYALREIGREATEDQIKKMLELVKSRAILKKSIVSKEEFMQIVSDVLG